MSNTGGVIEMLILIEFVYSDIRVNNEQINFLVGAQNMLITVVIANKGREVLSVVFCS